MFYNISMALWSRGMPRPKDAFLADLKGVKSQHWRITCNNTNNDIVISFANLDWLGWILEV